VAKAHPWKTEPPKRGKANLAALRPKQAAARIGAHLARRDVRAHQFFQNAVGIPFGQIPHDFRAAGGSAQKKTKKRKK
jgi:hypothetical protein